MDTRSEILRQTDGGLQVFKYYIPFDFTLKKNFKNPLYDDHRASCNIFFSQTAGIYLMKDFGDDECSGDCFKFAAAMLGLDVKRDFRQVLNNIIKDLRLHIPTETGDVSYAPTPMPVPVKKPKPKTKPVMKRYDYRIKDWSDNELAYWQKYGITRDVLDRFNVVPLSEYTADCQNGPHTFHATADSPMFAYMGKDFLKLYRPFEEHQYRFMYGGSKPENYCFGFKQLPPQGNKVIITGGEKDVMSLAAHGYHAVCFNSETSAMPESVLDSLSQRFDHVFIMYDTDETGKKAMDKAIEEHEKYDLKRIDLPLSGTKLEKDISDYFALGHTQADFQQLVNQALESVFAQIEEDLENCETDFDHPPEKSKVIISTQGVPLGSADNLMCVTGYAGCGKSSFVNALLAGALIVQPSDAKIDTLGYDVAPNTKRKAVVVFDTEQTPSQLYENGLRTLRRAGLENKPSFFRSIYLTALERKKRLKFIRQTLDYLHNKYGGVHLVVIDGVADLVLSVNAETECVEEVEALTRLANRYHTCIVCVVHFIPNGFKLRGHLGSELQRKCSGIVSIEKEEFSDSDASVSKAIKVRDGNPLEAPMYRYVWDKPLGMHVLQGQKSEEEKDQRKREELTRAARKILSSVPAKSYKDLTEDFAREFDVTPSIAKEYIKYLYERKILKSHRGLYTLNSAAEA